HLLNINITLPIGTRDYLISIIQLKSAVYGGWQNILLHSGGNLGYPLQFNFYDFPFTEIFHLLVVKIIYLVSNNIVFATNLFFILTFFTSLFTSLLVLRYHNINLSISIFVSLLFAITPYHMWRWNEHLFLSSYFSIPLWILISTIDISKFNLQNNFIRNSIIYTLLIFTLAGTGVYYCFCGLIIFTIMTFLSINKSNLKALIIPNPISSFLYRQPISIT
ncbi:MAG: hypothetical protein RLZZ293_765, partial [Pseudomonadota bacterium]